jgi:hypothetical protein
MAGKQCPFLNFQLCRNECNFYNDGIEGCVLSNGLLILVRQQPVYGRRLEKIEQYLLDASNTLLDMK